jgi:hypothetical protein
MNWQDILKMMTPRQFLEHFANILGGEVTGQSTSAKDDFKLTHDAGYIKVGRRGPRDEYHVNINGEIISTYNLSKIKERVEDLTKMEMEKVPGPVTTSSPAHSKLFRPTFGGGKRGRREEDERD